MPRIVIITSLTLDGDGAPVADLEPADSVTTTTGVVLAHHRVRGGAR